MSLVNTTLAAACGVNDRQLVLTAATGVAAGVLIKVDEEWFQVTKGYVTSATIVPVTRGQQGTIATAHANGCQATIGAATDWAQQTAPQTMTAGPIAMRAREIASVSGDADPIPLPTAGNDLLVVINGTAHTGLTLAAPTKDLNGSKLGILDLTGAAHVITFATGFGGGALVTATFDATNRCYMELMAYNEVWYAQNFSGTLTSFDIALS